MVSSKSLAMTWIPIGILSEVMPHGTLIAGLPAILMFTVYTSDKYIARGSFVFSPNLNATVGDVGAKRQSILLEKTFSKSLFINVRTF